MGRGQEGEREGGREGRGEGERERKNGRKEEGSERGTYSRLKKNVYKIILNYLPPFT